MFKAARLKLTLWYVVMIMLVSTAFSVVIYQVLSAEITRFAHVQEVRLEQEYFLLPNSGDTFQEPPPDMELDLLAESQHRILLSLIFIDAGILLVSAGVGYWLAGKTLEPIQVMVNDQNRFISDASHELKTPLTAMKSSLEVYLRDTKPTLTEATSLIRDSIGDLNRLQALSESLLQLSAYQQPLSHLHVGPTDLRAVVTSALERTRAKAALAHVSVRVSGTASAHPIQGDASKLTDVMVILLDNAIKYSHEKGTVNITVRHTAQGASIAVTDHGIGILPRDLPHIFDRFYRADTARTHANEGGYGLGLAIAARIARLHHGTLTAESKPNKGSTFLLSLPLSQPHETAINHPFRIFSDVTRIVERYVKNLFA